MACQVTYDRTGQVTKVLAPNNQPSNLYQNIRNTYEDLSSRHAAEVWAETYTAEFNKNYVGKRDQNGEPVFDDAVGLLINVVDEIRYERDTNGQIHNIAVEHGMEYNGTFPPDTDVRAVQQALKESNIKGIKVETMDSGTSYMTHNGNFYNPYQDEFQADMDNLRDWKLSNTVTDLLSKLGVQVEWVNDLQPNVVGQADVLNRVIKLAEGKADERTLTREMMHTIVSMMRGSARYAAMISEIKKMPVYDQTLEEYKQFDTYNEQRAAEEALVNYLSDTLEDEAAPRTWWDMIMDWLSRLFNGQGAAVDMFRRTARDILNQDLNALNIDVNQELAFTFEDEIWFEIEHVPESQQAVTDIIDGWNREDLEMDGDRYVWRGKKLRYRPSDMTRKMGRRIYGEAEFTPELVETYTTKGTIMHMYEQMFMQDLIEFSEMENPPQKSLKDYWDAVYEHLSKDEQFKKFDKDYFRLNDNDFLSLFAGVQHLYKAIMEEDPNAKIYTEQFIPGDDMGGTADILIVHGDGLISIMDYKHIRMKRSKVARTFINPDQDDRKLQLFDHQIAIYKNMLKEGLKIGKRGFRYTRIVPVNVVYTPSNDIKRVEIGRPGVEKRYLRQLVASHEYVPGDEDLNTFLEKLYNERTSLRNQLRTIKGKQARRIRDRVNQINKDISDILIEGDVNNMLEIIAEFVQATKRDIKEISPAELNKRRDMFETYRHFPNAFKNTIDEIPDGEYKDMILEKMVYFDQMLDEAYSLIEDETIERAQDLYDPTGQRRITDGGRGPSTLGRMFEGVNRVSEPVTETLFKLFRNQAEEQRLTLLKYEAEINQAYQAYVSWARKNGHGGVGQSVFDPLINENTRDLVSPFTRKLYDERAKILEQYTENIKNDRSVEKQIEWMKDHTEFNEELWKRHIEERSEQLKASGLYTEADIDKMLEWYALQNPNLDPTAYFRFKNIYIKFKDWQADEMKPYVSDKFRYIQSNEPAKRLYDVYIAYNQIIRENIGYDLIKYNGVAHFRASMVEKMSNWGFIFDENWKTQKGVNFGLGDLLGTLELREMDDLGGALDVNGMPLNRIPIVGTDELFEPMGDRAKARIRRQLTEEGFDPNSREFEDEFERRIFKESREAGMKNKSLDIVKSLKIMLQQSVRYRLMSEIEDEVLMVRAVLNSDKYHQIPTDTWSRRILNPFTQEAQERQGASADLTTFVDTMINAHLYGRRVQDKDRTLDIGGKQYSMNKLVDRAHNFLSFSTLALNPLIAGASHINASVQYRVQARRKKYYTMPAWKESVQIMSSAEDKALRFLWYIEPTAKNLPADRATRSSPAFLNRVLNNRYFFMLHRGVFNKLGAQKTKKDLRDHGYMSVENPYFGDDAVGNATALAMAKTWVVDSDGRVKNPNDPFHKIEDANAKTVYELFQESNVIEDFDPDSIPIEGMSKTELARFRALVLKAQSEIKGSTSPWDYSQADSKVIFQLIKKFRDWIPPMAAARYEGLRYDSLSETYTEGYINGTWKELVGRGTKELIRDTDVKHTNILYFYMTQYAAPTLGRLAKFFGEVATGWTGIKGTRYAINDKRLKYAYLKYLNEHPELDKDVFTPEAFKEFRQRQIRSAATEVRYYAMSIALIALIKNATDWDEEDNNNVLTSLLYRLALRTNLELSFWFDPQSVTDIIKSPIPLWRLITDTQKITKNFFQEESESIGLIPVNKRDKTPMGYYTMKRLPILNQILSIIGYFPGYTEEESTISRIFEEQLLKK